MNLRELLLDDARNLEEVASSSRGPEGTTKVLSNGALASAGWMISSSSRHFVEHSSFVFSTPCTRMLVDMAKQQRVQCGDFGLFALQMSASLVRRGLESRMHHFHLSLAFSTASVGDPPLPASSLPLLHFSAGQLLVHFSVRVCNYSL